VLNVPSLRLARPVRLGLACCCLALAALSALGERPVRAAPQATVVLARHALPAGHRLVLRDLRVTRWPRALAPPSALRSATAAAGRRIAGPLLAGEVVTTARLVGPDLSAGLPSDVQAVPIRAQADAADFVGAGDRVDLYAAGRGPVVRGVGVLAVLPSAGTDGGAAAELVVALASADASRIAAGGSAQMFAVVLDSP
jgi:Flp pilus assembly protein CpaB